MGRPRKNFQDDDTTQTVEVVEGPVKRDLAHIPEFLIRHFASVGKRVSLASGDLNVIGKLSGVSRIPIRQRDFGDKTEEFTEILTAEYGFQLRGSNFGKGDCLLYIQPFAAYEEQMQEGREVNEEQYGLRGFTTSVGAIDDILQKHGAGTVQPRYKETQQVGQLGNPGQ